MPIFGDLEGVLRRAVPRGAVTEGGLRLRVPRGADRIPVLRLGVPRGGVIKGVLRLWRASDRLCEWLAQACTTGSLGNSSDREPR